MSPSLTDNKSFGHFFCTVIYFPPLWNVSEALLEKKEKKRKQNRMFSTVYCSHRSCEILLLFVPQKKCFFIIQDYKIFVQRLQCEAC